MTSSPTFWFAVAAIFAVNAAFSWAWGASTLAVAQLVTAALSGVAGLARRSAALARRRHAPDVERERPDR